jgi:hypothetical protein
VLTPVLPGHESDLVAHLAALPIDPSPFAALKETHIARLAVIGQVKPFLALPRSKRRLKMRYLLFTAVANQPTSGFLEDLRVSCGSTVDEVWAHCVRYPGSEDPSRFLRYMTLNLVEALQTFAAYDASVPEILRALDLRARHQQFALEAQDIAERPAACLLEQFAATFPEVREVDER